MFIVGVGQELEAEEEEEEDDDDNDDDDDDDVVVVMLDVAFVLDDANDEEVVDLTHLPLLQMCFEPHSFSQEPQLLTSLLISAQTPSQSLPSDDVL